MNLFTDDNPKNTLKGLGFKNYEITKKSINKIEDYFDNRLRNQKYQGNPLIYYPKKNR